MTSKQCPKCGEVKPATSEYYQLVSATSKRGREYPEHVGRAYGACRVCRSKYNTAYNKTDDGKKARRSAYNKRREDPDYKLKATVKAKQRTRQQMSELIEYKGGKCENCGYDKCAEALDFHHVDPATKSFSISSAKGRSMDALKKEADKCILLCANCHREHHAEENQLLLEQQLEEINHSYNI